MGLTRESHNFSSGILWLKNPGATALLFSSGRIVMTGCCSEEDCQVAAAKYIQILSSYIPSLPWKKIDLKVLFLHACAFIFDCVLQIQNVVCSGNIVSTFVCVVPRVPTACTEQGFLIDLHGLQQEFPRAVNLDLHLFPGHVIFCVVFHGRQ